MVWVYEEPLKPSERKVQRFLEKRFKKKGYSEQVVKLLKLMITLKKGKFRSPKQIEEHFFYDKKHERPIFNEKSAKEIYNGLKQKGGSEYRLSNLAIQRIAEFLKSYDPTPVSWLVENGLWVVKQPAEIAKGVIGEGPFQLGSLALHGLVETGVSGVNGAATDVAGPVGFAAVGMFTGIAAAVGAALAEAEGDHAQAIIHAINFVPGIGPAVIKALTKLESVGKSIDRHRNQIANIPLVGDTLQSFVPDLHVALAPPTAPPTAAAPAAGGNRFSTRRRNLLKCPKTRRNKCAMF
jgi:hypothetical protein